MAFVNLVKPSAARSPTQMVSSYKSGAGVFLRDQLSVLGWLEVGACLNVAVVLAARPFIGRYALLLPFISLSYRIVRLLLTTLGILRNPRMDGVIMNKYSAQVPNDDGTFGPQPASKQMTILLIGVKNNHPLGMLAPGFKEAGDHMAGMQKELERNAAKYGMLGASSWLEQGRKTNNELLIVMYFTSPDGIHRYAHDPLHRDAWNWWNKNIGHLSHIAIWHEIYAAPAGHWENIYVNCKPTLMGGTSFPVKTAEGTKWLSPIVDARRGLLKSSKGRMTMTDGKDNDRYEGDPYENYGKLEAQ